MNYNELWFKFRKIHFLNLLPTGNWGVFFSFNVWNSSTGFNFFAFICRISGSFAFFWYTFFNCIGPRLERRISTIYYTNEYFWKFSFYLNISFSSFRTPSNFGAWTVCSFFGWTRPCIGGGGGGIDGLATSIFFIFLNSFVRLSSKFSMLFNFALISNNSSAMVASTKVYEMT